MNRLPLAACLLIGMLVGSRSHANESPRVLALTGRPIPGLNIAATSLSDSQLASDGGAWFLSRLPEPCNLFCSGSSRVSLFQIGGEGQGRSRIELGTTSSSFLIGPPRNNQYVVDSRGQYGAFTTDTGFSPTTLSLFGSDLDDNMTIAASNDLFVENLFAGEIGVGKPGEAFYSGQFQINQAIDFRHDTGIWRVDSTGVSTPVAREGNVAPGVPGALLGPIGEQRGVIVIGDRQPVATFSSSRGGVAFRAQIVIPGFDSLRERGVWVDRGDGARLVTRTSLPAPGLEGDVFQAPLQTFTFSDPPQAFSEPIVTDSGEVVFAANTRFRSGLWREPVDGRLESIVVANAEAEPAARPDERPGFFQSISSFDAASGHVVFTGGLELQTVMQDSQGFDFVTTVDERGVWLESPESGITLLTITETDDPFGTTDVFFQDLRVNSAGQALFRTSDRSGDIDVDWATALDRDGNLVELIRNGDEINVGSAADPDLRTVSRFELSDFDDAGRVLIEAVFDDQTTALLVSEEAAAPAVHGDYNGDGLTDAADYEHWRSTLGETVRIGDGADGNLDGVINTADYAHWRHRLTANEPLAASVVPEPSSTTLLALTLLAMRAGRQRHAR